jgi:hypothetical protein
MPFFGPKPNKMYVFIHYTDEPPTSNQQADVIASLVKGNPPPVFAIAIQLPEEHRNAPQALQEAYFKLQGSKYFFENGIGTGSTPEYRTQFMHGFQVTTVKGIFV